MRQTYIKVLRLYAYRMKKVDTNYPKKHFPLFFVFVNVHLLPLCVRSGLLLHTGNVRSQLSNVALLNSRVFLKKRHVFSAKKTCLFWKGEVSFARHMDMRQNKGNIMVVKSRQGKSLFPNRLFLKRFQVCFHTYLRGELPETVAHRQHFHHAPIFDFAGNVFFFSFFL